MELIPTADLARLSGLPASTLRYYEERGLIDSLGRKGLQRLFAPATLDRLQLIAAGQAAGFSLDDMAEMFGKGAAPQIDRAALARQADHLDGQIARLTQLRDGLRHAAQCSAEDPLACGKFRRILNIASQRFARTRP